MAWELVIAVLFGWAAFLHRVGARLEISWPSIGVGVGAFVLFTLGVHMLCRRWRNATAATGRPWRLRWSLAVTTFVVLLFVAGIALLGIVHQTGWLLTSPEPIYVSTIHSFGGRSDNNLKMMGLGAGNYADAYLSLPAGGTFEPDGTMMHSWETRLLPWIGYKSLDFNRPWNDTDNASLARCIVPVFTNPEMPSAPLTDADGYGLSHYAANSWVMGANSRMAPSMLYDGASTTLLIGEVNNDFRPWAHPVNWRDPARGINRSADGFGGPRYAGGAHFAMADGSVRFLSENISPEVLEALAHPHRADEVDAGVLDRAR